MDKYFLAMLDSNGSFDCLSLHQARMSTWDRSWGWGNAK
jgi:hypothetical protein